MKAGVIEHWYPVTIACLGTAVWAITSHGRYALLDVPLLLQTAITACAIAVGFLTTAKAILWSSPSRLIRDMRKNGSYRRFVRYLTRASIASFATVGISAVGLLFSWSKTTTLHTVGFSVWVFFVLLSGLLSFRAIHVFCVFLEADSEGA